MVLGSCKFQRGNVWLRKESLNVAISGHHPQPHSPIRAVFRWILNENFHGWRLHSLSGEAVPVSSWVVRCFALVWNFLCYSLCLLPVVLPWTPLRRIWLCFAHSHHLLSQVITCVSLHFIPYKDTKPFVAAPSTNPHQKSNI